eukprot:gene4989-9968_t
MDRGRVGVDLCGNKIIREKEIAFALDFHNRKLSQIKSRKPGTSLHTIDNLPPSTVSLETIATNPRKKKNQADYNIVVNRQNKILIQRIGNILTAAPKITDADYSKFKNILPSLKGANALYEESLRVERVKKLNQRIKKMPSVYNTKQFEEDYKNQLSSQEKYLRQVKYCRPKGFTDPLLQHSDEVEEEYNEYGIKIRKSKSHTATSTSMSTVRRSPSPEHSRSASHISRIRKIKRRKSPGNLSYANTNDIEAGTDGDADDEHEYDNDEVEVDDEGNIKKHSNTYGSEGDDDGNGNESIETVAMFTDDNRRILVDKCRLLLVSVFEIHSDTENVQLQHHHQLQHTSSLKEEGGLIVAPTTTATTTGSVGAGHLLTGDSDMNKSNNNINITMNGVTDKSAKLSEKLYICPSPSPTDSHGNGNGNGNGNGGSTYGHGHSHGRDEGGKSTFEIQADILAWLERDTVLCVSAATRKGTGTDVNATAEIDLSRLASIDGSSIDEVLAENSVLLYTIANQIADSLEMCIENGETRLILRIPIEEALQLDTAPIRKGSVVLQQASDGEVQQMIR